MIDILRLLRVKQWVKNTFIFFPLLFSGQFLDQTLLINCSLTFVGFCLISSSVYLFNDLFDHKADRLHPKKSKRLLSQGSLNPTNIWLSIFLLLTIGLLICQKVGGLVIFAALAYVICNICYNLYAKRIVILDVIFIAVGFQLRVWAGAFAAATMPSVWLQMCVFLLALFLGFTKRRHEISTLKDKASEHRSVLAHYTSYLLDQIIIICSTLAIVFYGLYTISPDIISRTGNQKMVYSVAFVIYGIFRYLYLVHVKKLGDDPGEVLFSDFPLLISILLWIGYVAVLIYIPRS